ncbi:hypothetical protein [Microseira sp. BLCC-F43]|uniref:hypothetical protein n=1 Tax=Microseira sp. BLCC-F43 TaxID=3153602 RepID=UPI0035BB6BBA
MPTVITTSSLGTHPYTCVVIGATAATATTTGTTIPVVATRPTGLFTTAAVGRNGYASNGAI